MDFNENLKIALGFGTRGKKLVEMTGPLIGFIQKKVRTYAEPARRGTAKGDLIGFSKKKFSVTLASALSDLNAQGISRLARVSYGVVRVWRTEHEFKILVEKNQKEFCEFFLASVQERVKRDRELLKEFFRRPPGQIAGSRPPTVGYGNIEEETKFFSNQLIKKIIESLPPPPLPPTEHDTALGAKVFFIMDGALKAKGEEPIFGPLFDAAIKAHEIEIQAAIIDRTVAALEKDSVSVQERKEVLFSLTVLKKMVVEKKGGAR